MVLFGHLIRLVAESGAKILGGMQPLARNLALLGAIVAGLALGAVAFELFIGLVDNRSGRCRVTSSTGFPVYLIYMVVPLGFFLGGVQFFLAGLRNVLSRDNYLSWYRRDEYESEEQAAGQTSFGDVSSDEEAGGDNKREHDDG